MWGDRKLCEVQEASVTEAERKGERLRLEQSAGPTSQGACGSQEGAWWGLTERLKLAD